MNRRRRERLARRRRAEEAPPKQAKQPRTGGRSPRKPASPPSRASSALRTPRTHASSRSRASSASPPTPRTPASSRRRPSLAPRTPRPRSPLRSRKPAPPLSGRQVAKRLAALVAATAAVAVGTFFGLRAATRLPLFLVDDIEVYGLRYAAKDEVRTLAGLDEAASIWGSRADWRRRVESHPMIDSVQVVRRLPSTLIFRVAEAEPVALIAAPLVMAVDRRGNPLPIDPANPVLDLPLVSVLTPDSAGSWGLGVLAREMEHVAQVAPEIFAVISEAHLQDQLVTFHVGDLGLKIRYAPPISERRLREGIVAMNDALERFPDRPVAEVDLRFADQVVVRTSGASASGAAS